VRPGRKGIVDAARREFAERGYGGASVRDIAGRAGVSMAALYYWYPGKHDLLAAILQEDLEHYFAACVEALEAAGDRPADQLCALVSATVRYRVDHPVRSSVVLAEGRSLRPDQREAYRAGLDRASDQFRDVIERGLAAGEFDTPFPDDARRTIIAACNAVHEWYRPDGAVGVADLVDRYAAIALAVVGARSPA